MKLNKTTLIAALALGSLLTMGATVNAQDATTNAPATTTPAPGGPGHRPISGDQWVKILALTDDEKTNFLATVQDMRKQMMAVRNDDTLSSDDRRAKNKAIRDASLAKVKAILNPEQFAKYQKMMSGGRRQAAPPAAAPTTPPAAN